MDVRVCVCGHIAYVCDIKTYHIHAHMIVQCLYVCLCLRSTHTQATTMTAIVQYLFVEQEGKRNTNKHAHIRVKDTMSWKTQATTRNTSESSARYRDVYSHSRERALAAEYQYTHMRPHAHICTDMCVCFAMLRTYRLTYESRTHSVFVCFHLHEHIHMRSDRDTPTTMYSVALVVVPERISDNNTHTHT